MATLLQFSRNIRSRASRIENNAIGLVRRVSKRTLRSLVKGTPVDTGLTRSNWRTSLVNRTRIVIPPYAPGHNLGINETANANAAISQGIQKINSLRVGAKRGTGQAGSAVLITNAVPYLGRLRDGHSAQQPHDWVELAFLEASAEIAQARLVVR